MRGGVRRRENCRLSCDEALSLLVPYTRQHFGQPFEHHPLRLTAINDRHVNVRRQQREPQ